MAVECCSGIELQLSPVIQGPAGDAVVGDAVVAHVPCEAASQVMIPKTEGVGDKRRATTAAKKGVKLCRVPSCNADLTDSSRYCLRHRICEEHFKSLSVEFDGKINRFCQKCTRFHEIHDFDNMKHSCRAALQLRKERLQLNKADKLPLNEAHKVALSYNASSPAAQAGQAIHYAAVPGVMKAGEIGPHNLSLLHLLSQLNQQVSAVPQIATSVPVSEPVPTAAAPPAINPNMASTLQSLQTLQGLASTSAPPSLQPGSPATALTLALQQVALLQQQPNVLQEVLQSLLRDILLTQSAPLLHQPKPPGPPAWHANGGEAKPAENALQLFAGPTSQPEQSNQ
eukprot:CAMPEP_0198214442 /NCGR_PEP_ID=MMETSP1445-20131203/41473_1 /TAXON_ID=36898 /ORGANISM="Pyramimonas sp., Strain CCMP2087" /LENGTH=340 /DNA_ID=CAMNT_0043889649 /DNA_START=172 /DNA_END=1194 /DNA_ORIENTATION=-